MTFTSGCLPPTISPVVLRNKGGFLVVWFSCGGECICHMSHSVRTSALSYWSLFTSGQAANLHSEAESIRRQCIEFLHYVKVFVFRWDIHTIYELMYWALCSCFLSIFWLCVCVCVFRYLEPPKLENDGMLHPYEELEAQLPSVLVEELYALTMHVGRLCELPSSVLAAFTIQHQAKVDVLYNFFFCVCV